jgi:hypothetical protein
MNPESKLFVYVISGAGHWIGVVSSEEFRQWADQHAALVIHDGRGMHFNSDPRAQTISVTIGPLYIGDTAQSTVAIFPTSVEIIGKITEDNDRNESCDGNNGLFMQYTEALQKWKASQSNITLASPADLSNIGANVQNMTNLRREK